MSTYVRQILQPQEELGASSNRIGGAAYQGSFRPEKPSREYRSRGGRNRCQSHHRVRMLRSRACERMRVVRYIRWGLYWTPSGSRRYFNCGSAGHAAGKEYSGRHCSSCAKRNLPAGHHRRGVNCVLPRSRSRLELLGLLPLTSL